MEIKIFLFLIYLHRLSGTVTFSGFTSTASVNENNDDIVPLTTFTATCQPQTSVGMGMHSTSTVPCTMCIISSNPQPGLFEIIGAYTVRKKACSDTTCGSCLSCSACSAANGCTESGQPYTITVQCSTSGYDIDDSGTNSLTVTITGETPALSISLASTLTADKGMSSGHVLTTASFTANLTLREWQERTAVENSHILGTTNLFKVTSTGTVIVNKDPSVEYSATYTALEACVYTRRQQSCATTTIEFWVINTTGNITVHPNYPDMTRTIDVRISNSASCSYTTDCTITITVTFTNHPISIVNNVTAFTMHEDTDNQTTVVTILSYDMNDPLHDNATCTMTNPDTDLFELGDDMAHDYNSYSIVKKLCTSTGCGFICDTATTDGCLNWNITSSYSFTVTCVDGYGSSASQTFTLTITRNEIFQWRNLPMTITENSNNVAQMDILFQILYTDAEDERLSYNYSVAPAQPTPAFFGFDDSGNYFNDTANVTSLIYKWDITNITYVVTVCAWERRNYRCEDLTIDVRGKQVGIHDTEFCGPAPTCDSDSTVVTDQYATGGTLFTINAPAPATGSYTSLSYAIRTQRTDLFTVDTTTGAITTLAALPIASPPSSTVYSIVGLVYDTAACEYASCTFSVTVNFTNMAISIDNMASVTVDIHEDTTTSVTLHKIDTSDANPVDSVSCSVDEANSDPANNGKFFTMETDVNSNEFEIISIPNPGFDYSVRNSYTIKVVCNDQYGSSATANMMVTISENQQPTMVNLDSTTIINVDPLTTFSGATLFTLQTMDAENDALTYSCSVANTWVPLHCLTDGVVSMRRNIIMPDENGTIFTITLCIEDSVHNHSLCETLQVNFTTSKSYPVLNNLPATVSFAEGTTVGTALFTATVEDPDVGDTHTFSIASVSPSEDTSKFSIGSSSGQITLLSALDFETRTSYNIIVSVRDQALTTLEDRALTVNVDNDNESPTLVLNGNTFSTTEGITGRTIAELNFTCTDPDTSESLTFALTAGTYMNYFALNGVSGLLTHALEWDFESGASLPYSTDLVVSCYDDEALTSSATIFINIATVNEHAPVPSTVSETFTIYSDHSLIVPLLTVTATDADYPPDGNFTFSIPGAGLGAEYFHVNSAGQLFVSKYIDKTHNVTYKFTIVVSDDDTVPLMASIYITVHYIAPDTTTVPTKPTKCILCTTNGIAVVTALCVEALLILCCICHICIRMKCCSIFSEKPAPTVKRVPRRRPPTISDLRQQLEHWSEEEDPELSSLAENEPSPPPKYRPDSTRMSRALPTTRPPSVFNYYKKRRSPPPPAAYHNPNVDLSKVPEPEASTSQVVPVSGYRDSDFYTPASGFQGRKRKRGALPTSDIPPAFKGLNPEPKRNIPQLYRDDDWSTKPIRPHEVSTSDSNSMFRSPNRKRKWQSRQSREPSRPTMSSSYEPWDSPRPSTSFPSRGIYV